MPLLVAKILLVSCNKRRYSIFFVNLHSGWWEGTLVSLWYFINIRFSCINSHILLSFLKKQLWPHISTSNGTVVSRSLLLATRKFNVFPVYRWTQKVNRSKTMLNDDFFISPMKIHLKALSSAHLNPEYSFLFVLCLMPVECPQSFWASMNDLWLFN